MFLASGLITTLNLDGGLVVATRAVGLVGHFEAERQQGTFDVIKSVEENLYLIESTMEDKTNELERILYSAIGTR